MDSTNYLSLINLLLKTKFKFPSLLHLLSRSWFESTNSLSAKSFVVSFNLSSHSSKKSTNVVSKEIWHQRLGHTSDRILNSVVKSCNISFSFNEKSSFCNACQYGKSHSLPFTISNSFTSQPLELIHCDLWGLSLISSTVGFRFYISFVDNCTRFTHIYPLKHKHEALSAFIQYKNLVENKFEKKNKTLQSYWGGEFWSFLLS